MISVTRASLIGIALFIMLSTVASASEDTSKEIYGIAARLSNNGSQLAAIGSKIEKSLSIAKEGSLDRGYLMIATYEIKNALLATGLSGQLIGAAQLVRQEERNSYFPRLKSTLENVSLSALTENKQFFDSVLSLEELVQSDAYKDYLNILQNFNC